MLLSWAAASRLGIRAAARGRGQLQGLSHRLRLSRPRRDRRPDPRRAQGDRAASASARGADPYLHEAVGSPHGPARELQRDFPTPRPSTPVSPAPSNFLIFPIFLSILSSPREWPRTQP